MRWQTILLSEVLPKVLILCHRPFGFSTKSVLMHRIQHCNDILLYHEGQFVSTIFLQQDEFQDDNNALYHRSMDHIHRLNDLFAEKVPYQGMTIPKHDFLAASVQLQLQLRDK